MTLYLQPEAILPYKHRVLCHGSHMVDSVAPSRRRPGWYVINCVGGLTFFKRANERVPVTEVIGGEDSGQVGSQSQSRVGAKPKGSSRPRRHSPIDDGTWDARFSRSFHAWSGVDDGGTDPVCG